MTVAVAMRLLRIIVLALGLPGIVVSAGAAEDVKTPSVAGVSIGSSESQVQKRLGREAKVIRHGRDRDLDMGRLREYRVTGLSVHLNRACAKCQFRVNAIEISGDRWALSNGLKVGAKRDDLVKLLGRPDGTEKAEGGELMVYLLSDRDGRLLVLTSDERVLSIRIVEENS